MWAYSTTVGVRFLSSCSTSRAVRRALIGCRRQRHTIASAARGIETYDVAVVGLGAMGSAALYHLSAAGCKVLGMERFDISNAMGSSLGHTRIIRKAFSESPLYIPLGLRAYELWKDLEEETERVLTGKDVELEYKGISLDEEVPVLFQPDGGFLLSEECIDAHCQAASRKGARIHIGTRVTSWRPDGSGVEITTDKSKFYAQYLVITPGPWMSELVPEFKDALEVERQVLAWYGAKEPGLFDWKKFPVVILNEPDGKYWYGTPSFEGSGMKIGLYNHLKEKVAPDDIDRTVSKQDIECMEDFMANRFPLAHKQPLKSSVCMFTNAPDGHFIIDWHPRHPQVLICSACSGHGFKFSSVIGEMITDMITNETKQEHELFKMDREALTDRVKFMC